MSEREKTITTRIVGSRVRIGLQRLQGFEGRPELPAGNSLRIEMSDENKNGKGIERSKVGRVGYLGGQDGIEIVMKDGEGAVVD